MPHQSWRARWQEDGRECEYLFYSHPSRVIARIDFLLACTDPIRTLKIPETFELEEVGNGALDGQSEHAALFAALSGREPG